MLLYEVLPLPMLIVFAINSVQSLLDPELPYVTDALGKYIAPERLNEPLLLKVAGSAFVEGW